MTSQNRVYIEQDIMKERMTSKGLKVLAFSFRDFTLEEYAQLEVDGFDSNTNALEVRHTFLALVALKDPVRTDLKRSVQLAESGKINVQLITGENLDTAVNIAVESGMLK